jgi:hypothetical protein
MSWDKEELIGLFILLVTIVGLAVFGKLTSDAVSAIEWVGGAFMTSKGLQGLLPGNK